MSDILDILRKATESIGKAHEHIVSIIKTERVVINDSVTWDGGEGIQNFDLEGAGTEQLSESTTNLTESLINNPSLLEIDNWDDLPEDVQNQIRGIAEARGITLETAQEDYFRFVDIVNDYGIDIELGEQYGTPAQLRFGYVVGDALDIDPAFASMMNPTGGFTGPGADSLNIDGMGPIEDTFPITEALAFHSPTHDAYGFLIKEFDIGPGYCYVPDGFCKFGPDDPKSGQVSGISFWKDELDINLTREEIIEAANEITGELKEAGSEIVGEFNEAQAEITSEFNEAQAEISEEIDELKSSLIDELQDAGSGILNEALEGDFQGVQDEVFDAVGGLAWETGEGTVEVLAEAGEGLLETGLEAVEGGAETVLEVGEGILETGGEVIEGAGEVVAGTVVDNVNGVVNLGEDAIDKISDIDIPFFD